MEKTYRWITNFRHTEEKLVLNYIALKAAHISDFIICDTARNNFGNIVPGYLALYFASDVSEKSRELFWDAYLFAYSTLAEKGGIV